MDEARPQAAGVVRRMVQRGRDAVRPRKIDRQALPAQAVRVLAHAVGSLRAVGPPDAHGLFRRDAVAAQLQHDLTDSAHPAELPADFLRLGRCDAADGTQALRLLFEDFEGTVAERLHNPLRRARPHALDRAGG